ncbi:putative Myb-like domain-containing protein [Seiridium cardinale]|uniref:Myb-like domain-containing protein n=1 Tax=Seiridium cardinale TaxID=138064 RepID=A0ABR2Y8U1_9PEZI
MAESAAAAAKGGKSWSTEESLDLVLTVFSHENPQLNIKGWKEISQKLQKIYPDKSLDAFSNHSRQQFQKIRRPFLAKSGGDASTTKGEGANDNGKPSKLKGSRKRNAPAPETDDADDEGAPVVAANNPRKARAPKGRVSKKLKTGAPGFRAINFEGESEVEEEQSKVKPKQDRKPETYKTKVEVKNRDDIDTGTVLDKNLKIQGINGHAPEGMEIEEF